MESDAVKMPLVHAVAGNLPDRQMRLLVGVSGGADSVALLRALHMLKTPLVAVHCNFHLRGEESMRDQRFVEDLCRGLGVPLIVADFNKEGLEAPGSVEELCRRQRYTLFRDIARERGCGRIAVAHNADDNVETLMLNLMRGAGLRGLAAMSADNGEILRPMLGIWREEILAFLNAIGQNYVTDSSNLDSDYNRNYIRNEILPALERRWPAARRMILQSQENLRSEESLLNDLRLPDDFMPWTFLDDWSSARSIVSRWLLGKRVGRQVVMEVCRAAEKRNAGRRWLLPDGRTIVTGRDGIRIDMTREKMPDSIVGLPAGFTTEAADAISSRSNDLLYIGADVTKEPYLWRHPQPGDTIKPLGMERGSQKVSKILKDSGMDIVRRKEAWVLENSATGEIIWIPGLRRSRCELVSALPCLAVKAPSLK